MELWTMLGINWGHVPPWLGINGEQVGDNVLVTL
jgi:hypothetical protein